MTIAKTHVNSQRLYTIYEILRFPNKKKKTTALPHLSFDLQNNESVFLRMLAQNFSA